ncbi:MAG: universal stress protein [Desulfobulbaceae bacterium]|nr:universal stress protein [Desulfobulbaceae bacterium]
MVAITNILVPVDLRAGAGTVLDHARLLADRFGAKLHLLTVIPGVEQFEGGDFDISWYAKHEQELLAGAQKGVTDFVAKELGSAAAATTSVRIGDIVDEILGYADKQGCDLIVIGTHGRKGVARIFFGSVAEGVVRRAGCPVLTLHPFE